MQDARTDRPTGHFDLQIRRGEIGRQASLRRAIKIHT